MSEPLVSIGMPVFNGERYLEAAIESNLKQSYENLELIVSDNASTDRSAEICRDLAASDRRMKFHRNHSNIGAAANYNRLFQLASGEFFRWSNADDLADADLIAQTLPILVSSAGAVIAFGRTGLIDANGRSIGEFADNLDLRQDRPSDRYATFYDRMSLTNIIYGLMRASAMRRTRLMGSGNFPHADVHFMATMTLQGQFVEVPRVLFYRRMHSEAMSANPEGQLARTFWSGSSARFVMPTWRFELAGIKAIVDASLPPPETARLLMFSARRLFWRRKELARDLLGLVS
jgi:glycosyltransferase involved in cell wall biosynthesis